MCYHSSRKELAMFRIKKNSKSTRHTGIAKVLIMDIMLLFHVYGMTLLVYQGLGENSLIYLFFSSLGFRQFVWLLKLDSCQIGCSHLLLCRHRISEFLVQNLSPNTKFIRFSVCCPSTEEVPLGEVSLLFFFQISVMY